MMPKHNRISLPKFTELLEFSQNLSTLQNTSSVDILPSRVRLHPLRLSGLFPIAVS
jgi:hypothetical protein